LVQLQAYNGGDISREKEYAGEDSGRSV
jgi:hypothetical protein